MTVPYKGFPVVNHRTGVDLVIGRKQGEQTLIE